MYENDPRREAALRILETARLLRNLVEHRLKPMGMSRAQLACLAKLEAQDGRVQAEMAELLEVQPITMVRLVDQLSAEGLIERRPDPVDRRCNRLHITDTGRARLAGLSDFKRQLGEELFGDVTPEDLSTLLSLLDKVHGNVKSVLSSGPGANKFRKSLAS